MSKINKIDIHNYPVIQHKLPHQVHKLIMLIGQQETFDLINKYGGQSLSITQNKTADGKKQFDKLAEVIGVDAAVKLSSAYLPLRKISVPSCKRAFLHIRNIKIIQRFNELTANSNMPAYDAVFELVMSFRISESQVWQILKQAKPSC